MPRLLLLSFLLLTAACKKEAAEPEPALQGRWNRNAFVSIDYDATGNVLATYEDQPTGLELYYTISADTIRYFENQTLLSHSRYAREGSVLHVMQYNVNMRRMDQYDLTITELTDARLVFQRRATRPGGYYSISTTTCAR
ncbi:hypothetical protein [Hymenobacter cellulosivorans]|uniref:Lipocalin-like domain-containing protein n=1 Tax=Hymenobacter cellulosivorans TaxID=2932249 RepID=A0ABY4F694_9BACT|nr:hypothetical protein [Hymenobacter cellulosivorans]UOQ51875.1 hypothetical protein MUN80_19185 [Hymenobacter cellulosivorans]